MVGTTDPSGYTVSTRRLLLVRPDSATRARARARGLGHYPDWTYSRSGPPRFLLSRAQAPRNIETGIAVVVDAHGKRRPDPAGYFCATRT